MLRTGIFGGSFNPVHNGHVELARQLLGLAGLDEIWFMVSPQNPLKRQADLLDERQRLALVQLALAGDSRLVACDYEFRLPRPSYTWNTLRHLSADYPHRTFTLLVGEDNLRSFGRWAHSADILQNYDVVVYPRGAHAQPVGALPPRVRMVDTPLIDISSTEIRRRIRSGEPWEQLVPPAVYAAIVKEGLYR